MKRLLSLLIVFSMFLAGCGPSDEEIAVRVANHVKQTVDKWPTPTAMVFEFEVTRIVEKLVTITPTETPLHTPTITLTPTITPTITRTPTITSTVDLRFEPRGDGFYLVNIDIAPGLWRSTPGLEGCYWARLDDAGEILDNHFGDSGGTVRIQPADFQVEFDDCGTWEYLGP